MWSEPTCISTHVLATRGCSRRHTAARGEHLDAAPRPEVTRASRGGSRIAWVCGGGEQRGLFRQRAALALAL